MDENLDVRSPLATKNPNILKNNGMSVPRASKLLQPSTVKKRGCTNEAQSESKPRKRMKTELQSHTSPPRPAAASHSTTNTMRRQTTMVASKKANPPAISSNNMRRQTSAGTTKSRSTAPSGRSTLTSGMAHSAAGKATKSAAPPVSSGGPPKSKRKAWDYKGRLEDMELFIKTNHMSLQSVITDNIDRISHLESINQTLEGTVETKTQQSQEAVVKIKELEEKVRYYDDELSKQQMKHAFEVEVATRAKESLERDRKQLENKFEVAEEERNALKKTVAKMTADSLGITTELQATKVNLEKTLADNSRKQETISLLTNKVEHLNIAVAEIEAKLRAEESVRRKLHNTVQELKGNIRVYCRVRPPLEAEKEVSLCNFSFAEKELAIESSTPVESVTGRSKAAARYDFAFDKVFQPGALQQEVFGEISQLVQSALDGYNVCIFAYGQTGSGKTFTMEGEQSDVDRQGMIPRAIEQVFRTAQELQEKGWQYEMQSSFLEIYNETIRDLLESENANLKYEIKLVNGSNGGGVSDVMVTNLTTLTVTSEGQVTRLLQKASHNRAVAATQCNERSSRSHSVFRLKITGENKITEEKSQGTLNLIDLAGSERLSSSGSSGDRLKETKNINKSLSNLGKVILALANKEQHIPYRNSKLTYLLQNCLGGNSKSLMFVNISPKEDSLQETLCSLRFATKVNQCNIGTAQKKVLAK